MADMSDFRSTGARASFEPRMAKPGGLAPRPEARLQAAADDQGGAPSVFSTLRPGRNVYVDYQYQTTVATTDPVPNGTYGRWSRRWARARWGWSP